MDKRVEMYFKAAYPDYESLSSIAQKKADLAKQFIEEHLPDLDFMLEGERLTRIEDEPWSETLRFVLYKVKEDFYTEALHPNYRNKGFLEERAAYNDSDFIMANLDKIEAILYTYYDAVKNGEAPEMSPEEMIKKAVKSVREMLQK